VLVIYIVLGVLYESFVASAHDPVGPAGGGRRRAADAAAVPRAARPVRVRRMIMLVGIVKKNAIMMIDFALEREREGQSAGAGDLEACSCASAQS
jgi:HAE1 family hydrophobic/amphiphilic exporter-1